MTEVFKPMLGASLDNVPLDSLKYPLLASPKLDGFRCLVIHGVAFSRNMKPIRNYHIQETLGDLSEIALDGELIVGSPTAPNCFNTTSSGVTAYEGKPDFTYHVFDSIHPSVLKESFKYRLTEALHSASGMNQILKPVPHTLIRNSTELLTFEEKTLLDGYEGVMLRHPDGPYKHGRSTLREGYLMKLKRFIDGEARVTGLEEAMENTNPLTRDELGRAHRTSHQENMVGKGMIGSILGIDPVYGPMRISPGVMPHSERIALWTNQASIVGKTIHWRAFGYGMKDAPRFARYYGIRHDVV